MQEQILKKKKAKAELPVITDAAQLPVNLTVEHVAGFLATSLGVVYVLFNDFQQLADRFVLGIWPFYIMAVLGMIRLRRTRPELERPYRALGYPVVPLIFLLASTAMVVNALLTDPVNTGLTFGIILLGIPIYYVWGRRRTA